MIEKTLFLDASVMLELVLGRAKTGDILNKIKQFDEVCISMLTVHLVYYFGLKQKMSIPDLDFFIQRFKILDLASSSYKIAIQICQNEDFEDALQLACAFENSIKNVITLDNKIANLYKPYFNFV
jgi:predicted nucleic acid-binding protein